jgi:hypothetical protein
LIGILSKPPRASASALCPQELLSAKIFLKITAEKPGWNALVDIFEGRITETGFRPGFDYNRDDADYSL